MSDLPQDIQDFVFDLHQATRRSRIESEIAELYDVTFVELSNKYYTTAQWPSTSAVASECQGDVEFLMLYRQITFRHIFTKQLKPQISDRIDCWNNFTSLFDFILTSPNPDMAVSTQWAYDIMQEFVYHFQDFCRERTSKRQEKDIATLTENPTAWTLPEVSRILTGLIAKRATSSAQIYQLLGYFAELEQARLECLLCDFSSSVAMLPLSRVLDRSELFTQVTSCHISVLWHTGVSLLMMRRYTDVVEVLTELVLHINLILGTGSEKRGANHSTMQNSMQKSMSLLAMAHVLQPSAKMDEQVAEILETKFPDRIRKLTYGDVKEYEELFEKMCPKFISPAIPDYTSTSNLCIETFKHQIDVFGRQVRAQLPLMKLRSYLRLWSNIKMEKLASLAGNIDVDTLLAQLFVYKHRMLQAPKTSTDTSSGSSSTEIATETATFPSDIQFFINDSEIVIEAAAARKGKGKDTERFFMSEVRKNATARESLNRAFAKFGM